MGKDAVALILIAVLLIVVAIIILVRMNKGKKKTSVSKGVSGRNNVASNTTNSEANTGYKRNPAENIPKEDLFKFMEFDKIEDNMIISQNGEKYTAVIRCKGINYYLMSEVEQLAVEEGFINFLNTLKYPVQLYVQAQNIDLKENISKYRENIKGIMEEYDDLNARYGMAVNSLDATDNEIEDIDKNRNRALNVLEYGQDIIRYVEKLSLNKNMLQRSFYVLLSYYKSEITGVSNFKPDEITDICYTELFTRANNVLSGLEMSQVSGEIMHSEEIAELLYSSYNRDDHNVLKVRDALDSGFYRLYSVSEDAISKKHKMLLENIKKEAEYKAVKALAKAVEDGTVVTSQDIEDTFDEEASKQALEMIKREKTTDDIKEKAKKIIIDEYKEAKAERKEEKEKMLEEKRASIRAEKKAEILGNNVENLSEKESEIESGEVASNEENSANTEDDGANDLIV